MANDDENKENTHISCQEGLICNQVRRRAIYVSRA